MTEISKLKQYYYCRICDDFYEERGIVLPFELYLSTPIYGNVSNCPKGHSRSINRENIIYLLERPIKNANSSIICLDIKNFSEKNQISQFNNISVLHSACTEIISKEFNDAIYKGTGDGFIIGLPSKDISEAIIFCENLINKYLRYIKFITYRIGIDYGLFFSYFDLSERCDFFGQSVIDVTRIADFGYNNHILLSENAAKNLIAGEDVRKENLIELGFCFDKHRKPYKVYNYKSSSVGAEFKEDL
jgi:GGDEF domain-containing protein